jgi:hypothetical protein
MDVEVLKQASVVKNPPDRGIHLVKDSSDSWVMILLTTGDRINKLEKLTKGNSKTDGWYWANEKTPSNFIGPFNNSIEALTNCTHTLQGNTNFVFDRDVKDCVKRIPSDQDIVVDAGIHSIQRRNGEMVRVNVFHSSDSPGNDLPSGFFWSADYAKDKATGTFTSPKEALFHAVKTIQEWGDHETPILDIKVIYRGPSGVTLH